MQLLKKILLALLSIATGCLFLYSAYTKIYSFESFERFQYTIVEFVHLPWFLAAHSARILTGMEGAIGALLILHLYGKRKWVLKIALLLLVAFSIYLVYLWAAVGNDVNCGCFGDKIWMSPSSSLIKNAVLVLVILLLHKFHYGFPLRWSKWITIPGFIICTVLPYIIYPAPVTSPNYLMKDKYELDLTPLYTSERFPIPQIDLRKGKHVIAFMSLTCPHCKMAAYKMQLMKKSNPDISMFLVLNGDSTNLAPFWKETGAKNIPHTILLGKDFVELAGFSLPSIYWINNSWVEANTTYIEMSQSGIEEWLKKTDDVK